MPRHGLQIVEFGRAETFTMEELSKLSVPALFIHGGRDPRTEPGRQSPAIRCALPRGGKFASLEAAGHSPHRRGRSRPEEWHADRRGFFWSYECKWRRIGAAQGAPLNHFLTFT